MRIITPLMKAMYAIHSLQRDVDLLSTEKFRVDPTIPEPKIGTLKLSGMGLDNSDLEKILPPIQSLHEQGVLSHLDLSNNGFSLLPEGFGELSSLKSLNLEDNGLTEFPGASNNLKNLRELRLSQNALEGISPGFGNMSGLRVLEINRNRLRSIPEEIGNLKNLKTLQLWGNHLRELPPSIGNLKKLESLILGYNQLRKFPREIGNLEKLTELRAERNLLTQIQDELASLTNLKSLNLWGNLIKVVTEEIANLEKLEKLSLDNNQLESIPESFEDLKALQTLYLDGNRLVNSKKDLTTSKKTGSEEFPKTPYDEILSIAKLKIEHIISKVPKEMQTVGSPLFDLQKQVQQLADELDIISKHRDIAQDAYNEKLKTHANLFCKELQKNITQNMSLEDTGVNVNINLSKFTVPGNFSQASLEKREPVSKKINGQRRQDGPGFKL